MLAVILILVLAVMLAGLGFAVHVLWWVALALLVWALLLWLIGRLVGAGEAGRRPRSYDSGGPDRP